MRDLKTFARELLGEAPFDADDWRRVAEALFELSQSPGERQLLLAHEEATSLVDMLDTVRPAVEAATDLSAPPNPQERLDEGLAREVYAPIRSLRRLDDMLAAIDGPDALSLRYELRAKTTWLRFAGLPGLNAIPAEDRET